MGKILRTDLIQRIEDSLKTPFATILYGPRRIGKTTLLQDIFNNRPKVKFVSGEDINVQEVISSQSIDKLKTFLKGVEFLVIDEAQIIENIGLNLKLIVDHIPTVKVVVSGSASFDLSNKLGEPLTGRKQEIMIYPISAQEIADTYGFENLDSKVSSELLIYGSYPYLFSLGQDEKQEYLGEIINSYLYKDILALEQIRNSKKIRQLLILLSFQIGKEVSLTELGNALDLNKATVERYLDLLEKSFVIFNVTGFSRNLRKEVTKTSRYYFYDNGILNGLTNNFSQLSLRNDHGALWENFLMIERIKKLERNHKFVNRYFWRTYDQKEIDLIEESNGILAGYEFKWSTKIKTTSSQKTWLATYSNATFETVNPENYYEFILN